ncbi:hypothetical protein IFR04_006701 [Cadophora malorum]|uniref:Uncharacterized protein n=1 Tax=Cadophora malorum TaxID=108018 RepID=A0A8H7TJN3_9HELO|nr:hypothetical protein IFR04_006701 [Cadophora malorum]
MDSVVMPLRPMSFQPKEATNSSSQRGMDVSISTDARLSPPRFAYNTDGKDTPSVPSRNPRRSQIWIDENRSREKMNQEVSSSVPETVCCISTHPIQSPRSPTFKLSPSPLSFTFGQQSPTPTRTPPMTKSSQKILQLTGFDPRFERALPIEHQQLSPTQRARPILPQSPIRPISSHSSGSFYSQAEAGFRYEQAGSPKNSSTSIARSSHSEGEYLTSSIYNISEQGSKPSNISRPNMKAKLDERNIRPGLPLPQTETELLPQDRRPSQDDSLPLSSFPTSVHSRDSNEITTLPEMLAQEQRRYDTGSEQDHPSVPKAANPVNSALAPSPQSTISKSSNPRAKQWAKPKHTTVAKDRKPSLLRAARDSLEWGFSSPKSSKYPSKSKHTATPVSPMFTMESDHLTLPPLPEPPKSGSRRKRFGTGVKHPLKSPFPFHAPGGAVEDDDDERTDSMPSPSTTRTIKRTVSSTIRHLSPTSPSSESRSSPPGGRKYVITNGARRADGPATPMPLKHGFMEGVMRGKGVLEKVGKSVVGPSKEEKRRESLKKRMVVVGITDQSPGRSMLDVEGFIRKDDADCVVVDGRVAEWL